MHGATVAALRWKRRICMFRVVIFGQATGCQSTLTGDQHGRWPSDQARSKRRGVGGGQVGSRRIITVWMIYGTLRFRKIFGCRWRESVLCVMYSKKNNTSYSCLTSRKIDRFSRFFILIDSEQNFLQNTYCIAHHTLQMLLHYLVKLQCFKNRINSKIHYRRMLFWSIFCRCTGLISFYCQTRVSI